MSDLMELVNECKPEDAVACDLIKTESALNRARELNSLGLSNVAGLILQKANMKLKMERIALEKFICITPGKIQTFLDRKAAAYNKEHAPKKKKVEDSLGRYMGMLSAASMNWTAVDPSTTSYPGQMQFEARTIDIGETKKGTVGRYLWNEVLVRNYSGCPPQPVLDRLKVVREKKIFDEFTIASVNEVRDPLLLGRVTGNENRYFLAQWGDDVCLDDLI